MRKLSMVITAGTILVLVVGGFIVATMKLHAAQPIAARNSIATGTPSPFEHDCSIDPGSGYAEGAPAITPSSNNAVALTDQDVKNYIAAGVNGKYTVVDHIVFLTSLKACIALRGVVIGVPPQQMVCLAAYHVIYSNGQRDNYADVYDAHTGNLLVATKLAPSL